MTCGNVSVRFGVGCQERGSFLALDLGGTNFRVLLITIKDKGEADMTNTIYTISNELMTGPGDQVSASSIRPLCHYQLSTFSQPLLAATLINQAL